MNNRYLQALEMQKRKTESHNPLIAGTLGITLNGQTLVEVPDRASYVYVQVRSSQAEVIQAFNATVSPVYGLPVMIQWQGNRYVVVERDTMRYSNWVDFSAYLPRHASTHEFSGSAGDVVFVSQEQFLPLMPMPSGTLGNGAIVINDYNLMSTGGTFSYFSARATQQLVVWNPLSPTGAIMVLVSLDATSGQLHYDVNSGTVFGNWLTGTQDVLPYVPRVTDLGRYLPIAAVRLTSGSAQLTWDNIYDVRPLFGVTRGIPSAGGGGGSASGVAILNNGVLENYANQLNLLGSSFTLTHSGTEAELTILGGGAAGGTGFLSLDTSNGPLYGPLVVYQKFPNTFNQYFDYSTIVGFLSGTTTAHFGAAVEAVNWSTGFNSYGIYIDEEGSNQALYLFGAGRMDNAMVKVDHNIDSNRVGGRWFSNVFEINRYGGGFPASDYVGAGLLINDRVPDNTNWASLEIDTNFSPKVLLFPTATGTYLTPFAGDYFPSTAPYFFDTYQTIPTGAPLFVVLNNTSAKFWIDPSGMAVSRGGYDTTYGTYNINGVPHTHVITGAAFSGPFPQPVFGVMGWDEGIPIGTGSVLNFVGAGVTATRSGTVIQVNVPGGGSAGVDQIGFFAERGGVPLGTGTILNVRGQNFAFTLSGTTADLFLTGTPFPQDNIGFFAERNGIPLGTGTIFNVRGQNFAFTVSGTTADLFLTGTPFPQDNIGMYGLYKGVPLGTGTSLNVRGPMLFASLSGTVLDLFATGVAPVYPQPVFGIYGEDEGAPLGTGTIINFRGPNVTATFSGTTIDVYVTGTPTIPIFPQEVIGIYGENNGVPLGTGSIFNVRGQNYTFTISGTTLDLFLTGTAPVFPQPVLGIMGWDEGIPLGTGTVMNFVGTGVTATLSGTVLNVNIPGGGGGGANFGVFGEDEGVPLGTGSIMNFRGSNVTASISGTALDVFITGTLVPWNVIATTGGFTMSPNQNYLANNQPYQVALRLPTSAQVGDMIRVVGMSSGTWQVSQQLTTNMLHFLNQDTTLGVTGYLSSISPYDAIQLVCVVRDNEWVVISSVGNITVV